MRKTTIQSRADRALEIQSLEDRKLFAGVVEPLSHSSDVEVASTEYDPADDLSYAHGVLGLSGAGQTVAIIDSGIAYDHYALGGGYGESHRVVGGWDFAENDADPYDDGPMGYHGTHIAGIVGSDDADVPGVAPGADLVALRVFDDLGHSDFDWIEEALAWVHENQGTFENPITTVNLSVGAGLNAESIPEWSELEDEFEALAEDGIFVAVAAGNGFRDYGVAGLNYPASSPHVIPVSSVNSSGKLSSFSQRHERALAVPGETINSTVPDYLYGFDGVTDDFSKSSGTSMATPYLAGASMLIKEAYARIGQEDMTTLDVYGQLYDNADTIYDSITNAEYQRVNLRASLDAILGSVEVSATESLPREASGSEASGSAASGGEGSGEDASSRNTRFTEAKSITMLGKVESISLLAATDRWFEFEAAQSGIMLASKMAAEVQVFEGDERIDLSVKDRSQESGEASQFFTVTSGQTYRVYVAGSSGETNLQQVVAFDGDRLVVRGDQVDDLHVSLDSSFVVSALGDRRAVESGGRLSGKQLDVVNVERTDHGLVVRMEEARVITGGAQAPNAKRISSSQPQDSQSNRAPHLVWAAASIDVGRGIDETSGLLLSEHAADEMFACPEDLRQTSVAILPARLLDELYSNGVSKVSVMEPVELPTESVSPADYAFADEALSTSLNRY